MSGYIRREDRLFDPTTGALVGYIDANGNEQALVSGAWSYFTNASALKPVAAALRNAPFTEVFINGSGDSLMQFGGDTVGVYPYSDALAERAGFLACLRRHLNARLGTPDGGQWIPAEASVSDTRVANTNGATVANWGPYNAYVNGSGTVTGRNARSLNASGANITFTVFGRYVEVEIWENAGTYVGNMNWTVDGSGGGTINSNGGGGATDTYRTVRLDLGTDANHVVSISWASGQNLITGATVTRGSGVVTRRFGFGGSSANNWAALNSKVLRTSLQTNRASLHIIRDSYNPWNRQVADGVTIANYKTAMQSLIDLALVNASAVLLVPDPATSTADNKAIKYAEFDTAQRDLALANSKVCFFDVKAATTTDWTTANALGWKTDFVHNAGPAFNAETSTLADLLLDPRLLVN